MEKYTDQPAYRGLHKAVLAEPDNIDIRLIMADWLEQNGYTERADIIRMPDYYGRPWSVHDPEAEHILEIYYKALSLHDIRGRHGFIEYVAIDADEWLQYHDRLTPRQPIKHVTLTTWPYLKMSQSQDWPNGRRYYCGFPGMPLVNLVYELNYSIRFNHRPTITYDLLKHYWPKIEFTWSIEQ